MATTNQFLQGIYIAYWGRAADPDGLSYWKGRVPTLQLVGVAENFASTPEGMDAYPYFSKYFLGLEVTQADRENFVEQIYMNLFNREVESEEDMDYWIGVLTDGEYSPGRFIADIMNTALVTGEADGETVMRKMEIAEHFTDQLVAQGVEWTTAMSADMSAIIAQVDNETTDEEFAQFMADADTIIAGGIGDQTFTLTINADTVPGLIGSAGTTDTRGDADVYVATNTTLTAADRIHDEAGDNDSMFYGQSGTLLAPVNIGAFEMSGVETLRATNDSTQAVNFDLSGTTDLESISSENSSNDVFFNQVTTLTNVVIESATTNADVRVNYQNTLLTGADDTVNLLLSATSRTNSDIGVLTLGSVATDNQGIENLAIVVAGADTQVNTINSAVTNVTIDGDGSSLRVDDYFLNTLRSLDAEDYAGNLDLGIGLDTLEGTALTALLGSGNDELWVAGGRLAANLGAGDDLIVFDTVSNVTNNHGFLADDAIDGGEGLDTLQLGFFDPIANPGAAGNFMLATTEFNNKGSLEIIDVRAQNTNMTLSQAFVDSAEQTLLITTDEVNVGWTQADLVLANIAEQAMVTTLDTTALGQNTPLVYVGGDGSDRIVLNDATFNSAIDLDGGSSFNANTFAGFADYDTLNVVGGSTQTVVDAADLANVRNYEGMNLVKSGATATFNIVLTRAFLNANTMANDDVVNTSIDDRVFQIFSAASTNGTVLSAGDVVNIEIGDLAGANLGGRGIDFTGLGAAPTVNFTVNGVAADAAQIAAITQLDAVGRPDVIASRANPVTVVVDNILVTTGADFNTTSGFQIVDNVIANNTDSILRVMADAHLAGANEVINLGGGTNTMEIEYAVNAAGNLNGALAAAIGVDEVVLNAGSTVNVLGAANQNITANAASTFTLGANGVGTGSDFADRIFADNGGSVINAGAGNDTVFTGLGSDTITATAGNNTIFVTGGNDTVTLGDGNDTVFVVLGDTEVHTLTLGGGADIVYLGNPVFTAADVSRVEITDFSVGEDRVSLNNQGNDVSFGTFHNDVGVNSNINLANAGILEIDGNAFQYVNVTDVASLLNHINNTSAITANLGAEVTLVSYNNQGDAAVYIGTSTINNNQLDNIELVGILDGIGINALTSANFM